MPSGNGGHASAADCTPVDTSQPGRPVGLRRTAACALALMLPLALSANGGAARCRSRGPACSRPSPRSQPADAGDHARGREDPRHGHVRLPRDGPGLCAGCHRWGARRSRRPGSAAALRRRRRDHGTRVDGRLGPDCRLAGDDPDCLVRRHRGAGPDLGRRRRAGPLSLSLRGDDRDRPQRRHRRARASGARATGRRARPQRRRARDWTRRSGPVGGRRGQGSRRARDQPRRARARGGRAAAGLGDPRCRDHAAAAGAGGDPARDGPGTRERRGARLRAASRPGARRGEPERRLAAAHRRDRDGDLEPRRQGGRATRRGRRGHRLCRRWRRRHPACGGDRAPDRGAGARRAPGVHAGGGRPRHDGRRLEARLSGPSARGRHLLQQEQHQPGGSGPERRHLRARRRLAAPGRPGGGPADRSRGIHRAR